MSGSSTPRTFRTAANSKASGSSIPSPPALRSRHDLGVTRFPPAHCGDIHAAIEEERRFVEEMKAKARPSRLQEILKARKANGSDETLAPG